MKPQTILFDLDDTLVHCNKYFDLVIEQFAAQLQSWFAAADISAETIKKKQLEIDTIGVNLHGFSIEHFPLSLVDTYQYFSEILDRPRSIEETDWLIQLGNSVFTKEVEPYPFMLETLEKLRLEGHRLYLYTGGVDAVQLKKVAAMRLETYFENRIFIRKHKNKAALEEIIVQQQFDRSQTWMIGNSLRTDILPSLEAGIHSIYVPAITEWEYNIIEIKITPKGAYLTVPTLNEVPEAMHRYLQSKENLPQLLVKTEQSKPKKLVEGT